MPEKFQPVVLGLHMHDINAGNHLNLRQHGLPMVTVGNTKSTEFIDRFYQWVKNFSYATSQRFGSNTAFCVELGIPYFFLGDKPILVNKSHSQHPLGNSGRGIRLNEKQIEITETLFSEPIDKVTTEQREFIDNLLGLDVNITRFQVSMIIWRDFFHNWRKWHSIPKYIAVWLSHKFGFLGAIKKLYKRLNSSVRRV